MPLFYTTQDGVEVYCEPGGKSETDFIVRYQEHGRRRRTPKHIHWIIDLYLKHAHPPALTMAFVDHLIEMTQRVQAAKDFPPTLQFFEREYVEAFRELDDYGHYSVEFLLVTIELIMIQEKTNYPTGTMNLALLNAFRHKHDDIFHVVSRATFR